MALEKNEAEKLAVALKYDKESGEAPKVVAKGRGEVAKNIVEKGKESGVESIENPILAKDLMMLELQEEIPEALYQAVAEVMAYIYRLDSESKW
ncbi:flagellar biosynthetic protein FlhB [Andreesenia angusta]|uniref:Flagellar biosynthetic protein FlhB n=1 Tax=Andreesenia angusta TaxID=39480 RepID=A0A1S1V830_9FIRM|nr:EscU/YscU/HrcU family type III secretion system export apparatus switch protein [Andreesenia angusta]OHW62742.1 flagellar biosynthetic protein FlhB [Andreesenia angusta]